MEEQPPPDDAPRVVLYVVRRDLRCFDNAILHALQTDRQADDGPAPAFTHLLPVYAVSPAHMDVSGFVDPVAAQTMPNPYPYPEATRRFGPMPLWPCGPHRAAFVAEAVWAMKTGLQARGSDLVLRVGGVADVVAAQLGGGSSRVDAVWMAAATGRREQAEEAEVRAVCARHAVAFRLFAETTHATADDDDSELGLDRMRPLFRTQKTAPLPPLPPPSLVAAQAPPFGVPASLDALRDGLLRPLHSTLQAVRAARDEALVQQLLAGEDVVSTPTPRRPQGGEPAAAAALRQLVRDESERTCGARSAATAPPTTPPPPLSPARFAASVGAYLAQGCTTAARVERVLDVLEKGRCGEDSEDSDEDSSGLADVPGAGRGPGLVGLDVRYQLLQRDYARVCFAALGDEAVQSGSERERARKATHGLPTNKAADTLPTVARYLGDDDNDRVQQVLGQLARAATGDAVLDRALREVLASGVTGVADAPARAARFLFQQRGVCWTHAARFFASWLVDGDEAYVWTTCKHAATSAAGRRLDPDLDGTFLRTFRRGASSDDNNNDTPVWAHLCRIQAMACAAHAAAGHAREAQFALAASADNRRTAKQTTAALWAGGCRAPPRTATTAVGVLTKARVRREPNTVLQAFPAAADDETTARHRMWPLWPAVPAPGLAQALRKGRRRTPLPPRNGLFYRCAAEEPLSVLGHAVDAVLRLALPAHELPRVVCTADNDDDDEDDDDDDGLDTEAAQAIRALYSCKKGERVNIRSAAWRAGWHMGTNVLAQQAEDGVDADAAGTLLKQVFVYQAGAGASTDIPEDEKSPAQAARDRFFAGFRRGLLARFAVAREAVRSRAEAAHGVRARGAGTHAPLAVFTSAPGAVPAGLQALLAAMVQPQRKRPRRKHRPAPGPAIRFGTWAEHLAERLAAAPPPTWSPCRDGRPAVHVVVPLGGSGLERIIECVAISVAWEGDEDGDAQRIGGGTHSDRLLVSIFDQVAVFGARMPPAAAAAWMRAQQPEPGQDLPGSRGVMARAAAAAQSQPLVRAFGWTAAPAPALRIELWHDAARLWTGVAHKAPLPLCAATERFFFASPSFRRTIDEVFGDAAREGD